MFRTIPIGKVNDKQEKMHIACLEALKACEKKLKPGNVFFMHMILMDSVNELAMNLGETYLVTETGNERLGKKKLDLVVGKDIY